jgi:hypothetical protein
MEDLTPTFLLHKDQHLAAGEAAQSVGAMVVEGGGTWLQVMSRSAPPNTVVTTPIRTATIAGMLASRAIWVRWWGLHRRPRQTQRCPRPRWTSQTPGVQHPVQIMTGAGRHCLVAHRSCCATLYLMNAEHSPIVSEFETVEQEASHDQWFRAKVEEALSSEKPRLPHDAAMAKVQTMLEERRKARA